jgi:hypothetical protein
VAYLRPSEKERGNIYVKLENGRLKERFLFSQIGLCGCRDGEDTISRKKI